MALSESRIRTAFRMLNIPYAGPLVLVDQIALNTMQFATYSSTLSAQTKLRTWLLTGMDSDSETKAAEAIDAYALLMPARGLRITGGSVGSISGLNVDVDVMMQSRVIDLQNLVPFFKDLCEMVSGASHTSAPVTCSVNV